MGKKEIIQTNEHINHNCLKLSHIKLPEKWECIKAGGIGPFITRAVFKNPEEELIYWESRHHRKHHFKLDKSIGSTWWAPGAIGWWIGILFAIGSFFFALGSIPNYINYVGITYDSITYFVGSLFFTSAGYLQYIESINAPHEILNNKKEKFHFSTFEPKRIDWWATLVQFLGTILFNISTANAIQSQLNVNQINHLVWTPDVFGSTCFLIASSLAWWEVSHSFWSWTPKKISWWIAILNLIGSIAFGISAAAAYVLPTTGLPKNEVLVNLGTFIGAICFLIGGLLILPERTKEKISKEEKYQFLHAGKEDVSGKPPTI